MFNPDLFYFARELPALGTIVFKLQKENNGRKKKDKFTEVGEWLNPTWQPLELAFSSPS